MNIIHNEYIKFIKWIYQMKFLGLSGLYSLNHTEVLHFKLKDYSSLKCLAQQSAHTKNVKFIFFKNWKFKKKKWII